MTNEVAPVVLTGFMGAGKSTVGALVAKDLGRRFIDVDDVIAEKVGQSCGDFIRERGAAEFRTIERECIESLLFDSARDGDVVIALGGGATCDHGPNTASGDLDLFRRRVLQECTTVLLDIDPQDACSVERFDARMKRAKGGTRPLLNDDAPALLRARLHAYRAAFLRVDALLPLDDVVANVVQCVRSSEGLTTFDQRALAVRSPHGAYAVWLADNSLDNVVCTLGLAGKKPNTALVVTSAPIRAHADRVARGLKQANVSCHVVEIPVGEEHKNVETLAALWSHAADGGLGRDDVVIAVGGGVVGDIAGFCAATYMRGMRFVQVPTTLLSIVDASVGGKVAIDRPQGKNMVGAFWSPTAVVVDPAVFSTLPAAETRAGLSEALKHAYLSDDDGLRQQLREFAPNSTPSLALLRRSIAVKRDVVECDPFEHGERATLNFGHTFAHALEHLSGFTLRHGDAVAVGMLAAAHLGVAMGITTPDVVEEIRSDLIKMDLEREARGQDATALARAMESDKKKANGRIRLVLLKSFGDAIVVDDPGHDARVAAWRAVGASG